MSEHIVVDGVVVGFEGRSCDETFGDGELEYLVRTQRFPDGQQEVVAFSTQVWRHFNEIRLRPRGARASVKRSMVKAMATCRSRLRSH